MMYRRSDFLQIVGYSDSDYVGDDRKSTLGYVFTVVGEAISNGKLNTNHHYIIHNVYRVYSML
jgi:hypothetical protein